MSIERERLLSLIEFAQQSARMRSKPAATVAEYGLFALYEHQIQGLPGIRLDVSDAESEDEIGERDTPNGLFVFECPPVSASTPCLAAFSMSTLPISPSPSRG